MEAVKRSVVARVQSRGRNDRCNTEGLGDSEAIMYETTIVDKCYYIYV